MKKNILTLLLKDDRLGKIIQILYSNPIEKYSLRLGVLFVVAAIPIIYFDSYKVLGGWLILIAIFLFIIYTLSAFLWNIRFIMSPTASYFSDLTKRIEAEDKLIAELATENLYQLSELFDRLQFERNRIISKLGFLVGAIDKLGIIPAVLILYLSYAKTLNDPKLELIPYQPLSFITGIYIGCFFLKHVLDRIDTMCYVIENAKKMAEEIKKISSITSLNESLEIDRVFQE